MWRNVVSAAAWAGVARFDGEVAFGIQAFGTVVEIGRADTHELVVDDQQLGMDDDFLIRAIALGLPDNRRAGAVTIARFKRRINRSRLLPIMIFSRKPCELG